MSNSGDLVRLIDDTSTEVDFVAWEGEVAGWNVGTSTGNTIARADLNTDSDTDADWTTIGSDGTPGAF